jgi:hypothetical protein
MRRQYRTKKPVLGRDARKEQDTRTNQDTREGYPYGYRGSQAFFHELSFQVAPVALRDAAAGQDLNDIDYGKPSIHPHGESS